MDPSVFIGTPLHDGRVHHRYLAGVLQTMALFPGRMRIEFQVGSFLPWNRDALTSRFLESKCSHMLCVDSDVGWTAADAKKLIEADVDVVSGCYAQKNPSRALYGQLLARRNGELWEADHVPAGFLLLKRAAVERMVEAYPELQYSTGASKMWALWASLFEAGANYVGEDVAFCRRWRAIGGELWLHTGVTLQHFGEFAYVPDLATTLR